MKTNPDARIDFKVNDDRTSVRMIVPADFDPAYMGEELLVALAREKHIDVSAAVARKLKVIASQFIAEPGVIDEEIATWTPPTHGIDGSIVIEPHLAEPLADTSGKAPTESTASVAGKTDHYNVVNYVRVTTGAKVATLHPPTEGEDGRDVLGKVINARAGKPPTMKLASGVSVASNNDIVAQIDGVLLHSPERIEVVRLLEVAESVDFSTGNIDFDGSVVVRGGVCPRFKVTATEDVTIDGLIEAADIACGGTLRCRRGIAGQDKGTITVQGDAHAAYLNSIQGRVFGHLNVANEIMSSVLVVDGDLNAPRGSIIGGEVTVGRSIRVDQLGSEAETPTTIILGTVPRLDAGYKELLRKQAGLEEKVKRFRDRERMLNMVPARNLSPTEKEEITLISFEISEAEGELSACATERLKIEEELTQSRMINVEVGKGVHPKVELRVENQSYRFDKFVKGPVQIGWGPNRQLQFRRGNGPATAISQVARTTAKAA